MVVAVDLVYYVMCIISIHDVCDVCVCVGGRGRPANQDQLRPAISFGVRDIITCMRLSYVCCYSYDETL